MLHRLTLLVALLYVSNAPALSSYMPSEIAPAARATKFIVDNIAGSAFAVAAEYVPVSLQGASNAHPLAQVQQQLAANLN